MMHRTTKMRSERAFPWRLVVCLGIKWWCQGFIYSKFFRLRFFFTCVLDLVCVFRWKWKCVCVLQFVWDYKRIKACSQPRVQTGPFLIVPSVCPIGWWGINLPLCCYMCLCQTVWACLSKNSNISFLISSCQEPTSLPPPNSGLKNLPRYLQLWHLLLFYW